jgi:Ca2+-transporting ATPase
MVWVRIYKNIMTLLNSLLKGLTFAMSILPEEIPVALLLLCRSYRLMKEVIVKK